MMQEKSSNDHDENKENLMNDLETTVEIKEKVITAIPRDTPSTLPRKHSITQISITRG